MIAVILCEKFGWTYQEYLDQPVEFIELAIAKMDIDNQEAQKAHDKANKTSNHHRR